MLYAQIFLSAWRHPKSSILHGLVQRMVSFALFAVMDKPSPLIAYFFQVRFHEIHLRFFSCSLFLNIFLSASQFFKSPVLFRMRNLSPLTRYVKIEGYRRHTIFFSFKKMMKYILYRVITAALLQQPVY